MLKEKMNDNLFMIMEDKLEFAEITPTNKVLEITGVDIDKIIDGEIVEYGGTTNIFKTFFNIK